MHQCENNTATIIVLIFFEPLLLCAILYSTQQEIYQIIPTEIILRKWNWNWNSFIDWNWNEVSMHVMDH